MKFKQYILAAAAAAIMLLIVLNIGHIFHGIAFVWRVIIPFLWGLAVAYVLNRPMMFFERKVYRFRGRFARASRAFSAVTVLLIAAGIITGFFVIIIPEVVKSISLLLERLPQYIAEASAWVQELSASVGISADMLPDISDILSPDLLAGGMSAISGVYSGIVDAGLALITAIYALFSREKLILQAKKFIYAVFSEAHANSILAVTRDAHRIFSGFISGKVVQMVIVFLLQLAGSAVFGIPYALLTSAVIALFNIIPFVGPFIGAIPCALLLIVIDVRSAVIFIIITMVVQQLDGQIIQPRILGEKSGLSGFWVIIAIGVGGGLFGFTGMLLGVPVFAIIYAIIKRALDGRLRKKGLSTCAADYNSEC